MDKDQLKLRNDYQRDIEQEQNHILLLKNQLDLIQTTQISIKCMGKQIEGLAERLRKLEHTVNKVIYPIVNEERM